MFSHMAIMYAYGLYQRGLVKQGYKVLDGIYQHCQDFKRSHIYPGIPEYIDDRGRGRYTYLTGSASWYLLTLITEVFGVRGHFGDLVLEPKLMAEQFDQEGKVRLVTRFSGRQFEVVYLNASRLDPGNYDIYSVRLDGKLIEPIVQPMTIPRVVISSLDPGKLHRIEIELR